MKVERSDRLQSWGGSISPSGVRGGRGGRTPPVTKPPPIPTATQSAGKVVTPGAASTTFPMGFGAPRGDYPTLRILPDTKNLSILRGFHDLRHGSQDGLRSASR